MKGYLLVVNWFGIIKFRIPWPINWWPLTAVRRNYENK